MAAGVQSKMPFSAQAVRSLRKSLSFPETPELLVDTTRETARWGDLTRFAICRAILRVQLYAGCDLFVITLIGADFQRIFI